MVKETNPSEGVLIDLDIAARVNKDGSPLDGETLPPAGTLQFRAFELITPQLPTKSFYRHDLESFFYALLWVHLYVHRSAGNDQSPHFDFDFRGTWPLTRSYRVGYLISYRRDWQKIPPGPLSESWLAPLRRLFGAAMREHPLILDQFVQDSTLGDAITFQTFFKVLQESLS